MTRRFTTLLLFAAFCSSACDKPPAPTPTPSAKASSEADKVPTPSASAPASAASSAAYQSPSPTASAGAKTHACGAKEQPLCPLQAWMKANMQPALASGEAKKLAAALRQSVKLGPQGYGDWAKLANEGAAAVEAANDVKAGKPSCKACHELYQKPYKAEFRDRPL